MLKNLLNTEVVQVVEQAKDWREAVAISCRPLIENGSIERVMLMRSIARTTLSVRTMWLALVLRCLMRARKRELTSCH